MSGVASLGRRTKIKVTMITNGRFNEDEPAVVIWGGREIFLILRVSLGGIDSEFPARHPHYRKVSGSFMAVLNLP